MKPIHTKVILAAAVAAVAAMLLQAPPRANAQIASKMKMTTEIPADITTPDSVETRLGTLRFSDGRPDAATVEKVYDNLDVLHAVDVFLNAMSAASLHGNIVGLKSVGGNAQTPSFTKTALMRRRYC